MGIDLAGSMADKRVARMGGRWAAKKVEQMVVRSVWMKAETTVAMTACVTAARMVEWSAGSWDTDWAFLMAGPKVVTKVDQWVWRWAESSAVPTDDSLVERRAEKMVESWDEM